MLFELWRDYDLTSEPYTGVVREMTHGRFILHYTWSRVNVYLLDGVYLMELDVITRVRTVIISLFLS